MTRSDLVRRLQQSQPALSDQQATLVVDTFFAVISRQMTEDGRVELRNFGIFSTRERKARTARNPRTGVDVEVPEKRAMFFRPGKALRNRLMLRVPRRIEEAD